MITCMIAARIALLLNLQKKRLETVKAAVVVVENSRRAVLVEDRRAFDEALQYLLTTIEAKSPGQ